MSRMNAETAAMLADLHRRIDQIVEAAKSQGRDEALGHIRSLVGGTALPAKRGPGRPRKDGSSAAPAAAAPKQRRKNSWAGLSAADRLARVNAIRKGKGLPPRTE